MRSLPALVLAASALSAVACGGGRGTNPDIEPRVTISQGIYGQTTYYDDEGSGSDSYAAMDLLLWSGSTPIATTRSGEQGFYEFAVAPGDYQLCTSFARCIDVHVDPGARVRRDYEMGPGPGW